MIQIKKYKKKLENNNKYESTKLIKLAFSIAVLVLAYFSVPAAAVANPMANWKFDETAGTVTVDSSGNRNSAILMNNPVWTTGKIGNALQFNGINQYAWAASSSSLSIASGSFTITSWVYATGSGWRAIVGKGESSLAKDHNYMLELDTNGKALFAIGDGIGFYMVRTTAGMSPGWHHIAAVFNSTSDIKIYFDGVLQATTVEPGSNPATQLTANGKKVTIGDLGAGTDYFNGKIDELKIYNTALSAADINAEYMNTGDPAPTSAPLPQAIQAPANLVTYYNMNESSGTAAADSSGNGNNAILVNNPVWTTGKIGNALQFNGINQYALAASSPSLNIASGSFTITSWVYATSSGWRAIVGKGESSLAKDHNYMLELDTNGKALFAIGDGIGFYMVSTTAGIGSGWHHIAAVFNSTSDIRIYFDGVLQATTVVSGSNSATQLTANGKKLTIGDLGGGTDYFNGKIDEFKIYNKALSAADVNAEYQKAGTAASAPVPTSAPVPASAPPQPTPTPTNLLSYWNFNKSSGTVAADSSGDGNDATLVNSPTWVNGRIGNALQFNGINQYAWAASSSSLSISSGSFTITSWVYATGSGWRAIIGKGESSLAKDHNYMLELDANGNAYFAIGDGNGFYMVRTTAGMIPGWHHIAAVFNSTSDIKIYFDGVLQATTVVSGSVSTTKLTANSKKLTIGDLGGGSDYFNGIIDELKIYNRALSAADVSAEYQKAGSAASAPVPAYVPVPQATPTPTPAPAPASTGTLLWDGSFHGNEYRAGVNTFVDPNGNYNSYTCLAQPESFKVVDASKEPGGRTGYAGKFYLGVGSAYECNGNRHNMIVGTYNLLRAPNKDTWIGYSQFLAPAWFFYAPVGSVGTGSVGVAPNCRCPYGGVSGKGFGLATYPQSYNWEISLAGDSANFNLGDISGAWYDFAHHIKWARDNTGFYELYVRKPGEQNYNLIFSKYNFVTEYPQPGDYDSSGNYVRFQEIRVGDYGDLSATNPQTLYIMNPKVGTTMADVIYRG